jgi:chemotaxis protein CheD
MEIRHVKMAEIVVVQAPVLLKTTLGSCVGVVVHDRRRSLGGLAHVMLPRKLSRDDTAGKYADTAIPALLGCMRQRGSRTEDLTAFLAGGANMFRQCVDGEIATIGAKNVEAVKKILADLHIPITFEDTGGDHGRTVVFDSAAAAFEVRRLQQAVFGGKTK